MYVVFKNKRIPKLNNQQQKELLWKYRNDGDIEAYNKLVLSCTRLVMKSAMRIIRLNKMSEQTYIEDVVQEGMEGLVRAINVFKDPHDTTNFMSFASKYIKGRIWKYVKDNANIIRRNIDNITRESRGKIFYQLSTLVDIMTTYDPELKQEKRAEFANRIHIPIDIIIEAEKRWAMTAHGYSEEDGAVQETFSENVDLYIVHGVIMDSISKLKEKQQELIINRFFCDSPKTLTQIGRERGCTFQSVEQMMRRSIINLKTILSESQVVREFMEI